jgi:hypothetical protein
MSKKTMLDAALALARKGLHVFPAKFVGRKKLGCTSAEKSNGNPWGYTRDPDEIKEYWRQWPRAAIGLPTGAVNGFFVLDLDTKAGGHDHDGEGSYQALLDQHRTCSTLTRGAITPTGGLHIYYKQPPNIAVLCSTSKLGSGIDVRGDGGFVIAPPSVRPGKGAYEWRTTIGTNRINSAPSWLLGLVVERPRPVQHSVIDPASCDPEMLTAMRADAGTGLSIRSEDNATYAPISADDLEQEMRAALMVIPSDDYHDWIKIGAAIRAGLGDAGSNLFHEWSQGSSKYDERECAKKWDKHIPGISRVTVNTIFWLADQHDPEWRDIYRRARAAGVQL